MLRKNCKFIFKAQGFMRDYKINLSIEFGFNKRAKDQIFYR